MASRPSGPKTSRKCCERLRVFVVSSAVSDAAHDRGVVDLSPDLFSGGSRLNYRPCVQIAMHNIRIPASSIDDELLHGLVDRFSTPADGRVPGSNVSD